MDAAVWGWDVAPGSEIPKTYFSKPGPAMPSLDADAELMALYLADGIFLGIGSTERISTSLSQV